VEAETNEYQGQISVKKKARIKLAVLKNGGAPKSGKGRKELKKFQKSTAGETEGRPDCREADSAGKYSNIGYGTCAEIPYSMRRRQNIGEGNKRV